MLNQSLYLFVSKVLGYGFRILLPAFLVRVLTKEEFGAYSQFFLLEVLIQTVFQMGINQSLYYFVPRDRQNAGAYLVNTILLNILAYSLAYSAVLIFKDQIADQMGMQIIHTYFWHLALYSLLMMLIISVISYLTALQKIKEASIISILHEVLASIATLFAAYFLRDLTMIIVALIISRALSLTIGILYIHFGMNGFRSRRYFFGIRDQVKYGVVLGVGGTIWVYSLRLHELMVSRNYDIATYAVYAAGCKQIPFLQFFSQSIAAVALGQFAVMVKENDWNGVRKLWNKIQGIMYGAGIPIVLILLAVSRPLVLAMFTEDYADAIPIFRFFTIGYLSSLMNSTLVLRALNRNDVTLKVNAAFFVLLPFALYGGMKVGGMQGIIATHVFVTILSRVVTLAYLNHLTPVRLPFIPPLRYVMEFYRSALARARFVTAGILTSLHQRAAGIRATGRSRRRP